MKHVFILLFPQKEYLDEYLTEKDIQTFNECIEKRYLQNGFEFFLAKYKGSDNGFCTLKPKKVVEANITFKQSSPYFVGDIWQYADFNKLATDLDVKDFDNVVLGGFHCFSCVEMLAQKIYKINKNIIIDSDLTELFWGSKKFTKDWQVDKFNPDQKIERILKYSTPMTLKSNKEKYSHPIWGISTENLKKMDEEINILESEK